LRDYLDILIKCGIVERKGRGKYQITWAFKKEFARKSNKDIIDRYSTIEIADKAHEHGITLYGLEGLMKLLEKTDTSDGTTSKKHLKGEGYFKNIETKLSNISSELWMLSADIELAQRYLVSVFLFKHLKRKEENIKEFFRKHNPEEVLDIKWRLPILKAISFLSNPIQIIKYFPQREVETAKDYLKLNKAQREEVEKIIDECWKNYFKVKVPFSLFYSDIKNSPSPLTLEGALKESRIDVIMNDKTLSIEEQQQRILEVEKEQHPESFANFETWREEDKVQWEKIQKKLKEVGDKYGANVCLGDIPEVREILEKRIEKLLIERKKIEEKG